MRFTNRQILKIAGPILVSVLMEHLIGMTDTAFLGRVGEVELGASALAGVYYLAIFMLGFGFSTGVQIMIGRRAASCSTRDSYSNFFWLLLSFLLPVSALLCYSGI